MTGRPISNIVPIAHRAIAEALTPMVFEMACRMNDVEVPLDEGAKELLRQCVGYAFSLGAAYGQTNPDLETPERMQAAFDIIAKGKLR